MQTERRAFILKSTRAENLFFHSILREFSLISAPLFVLLFFLNKNIIFARVY